MNIEKIPNELKERLQWVLWKLEKRNGKDTKVPYQINGKMASVKMPDQWTSFLDALEALQRSQGKYKGLGYVFSAADPFLGIDLDNSVVNGKLTDEAREILIKLNSYSERSQSKKGVHVIVKASMPGERNRIGNYEMYDNLRFFVVTGDQVKGAPDTIEERQTEVNELYNKLFEKREQNNAPIGKARSTTGDQDIISIALKAKNGEKFRELFTGDWSAYGSQSEADQALCNIISFYTQNQEQIDRIFRTSGLMRDKWEREDYRKQTIQKAIIGLKNRFRGYTGQNFDSGDKGNAERLVYYHGGIMRYCHPYKAWFIWDGVRWRLDDKGNALELAMTIAEMIENEIPPGADLDADWVKALRKQASMAKSKRGIDAMLALAAPTLAVSPNELDADKWLINLNNGILDLRTGDLLPHDPAKLMTKLAPVEYDPAATSKLWENTIGEIFKDENGEIRSQEIQFLQKALGYSLTGSIQEHAFFIMHGRRGRNGKGVIFNTVAAIMGDYATQINANVLLAKKYENSGESASPGIAKLKGARLVLASETDRGRRLDEALVKGLTGGDPVTARFLNQNEFTFMPEFKLFLQTNYAPNVDGSDQGIWDRIKKLDFFRYFEEHERDSKLPDKLKQETNGIFRWMVEGCLMWQREGIPETEGMRQGKNEFLEEMDAVPQYAQDNLVINPLASVNPVELYNDYETWCLRNDEYTHKKREFLQRLEAFMSRKGHVFRKNERDSSGSRRVHKGVGLKVNMQHLTTPQFPQVQERNIS